MEAILRETAGEAVDGMDHKSRLGRYIQKLVDTNNLRPELTVEMAEALMVQSECILACLRGFIIFEELKRRQRELSPVSSEL